MTENKNNSWWRSIPGILTSIAGVLTAITGLIIALNQIGFFGTQDTPVITGSIDSIEKQEVPMKPSPIVHCDKPTTPVLVSPGSNKVQPNHHYGKGKPLHFSWLDSSCNQGSIKGYRIVVKAVGATVPATDEIVTQTEYTGNTGGTISARKWTWKVQAIDDQNQLSEWSEERPFFVGEWKE